MQIIRGKKDMYSFKHMIIFKRSQEINDLSFNPKKPENEQKINFKDTKRKGIINRKVEISEIENKCTVEKSNKAKHWFFKKLIKWVNPSKTNQEKKIKIKNLQIINIRN